jgi:hypothetical protein
LNRLEETMNNTIKKSLLSVAIAAALIPVSEAAQAVTITWQDQSSASASFPGADPDQQFGFTANAEFRFVYYNGSLGAAGQKSIVNSDITWTFDNTGVLTSIVGSDIAPTATGYGTPTHPLPAHEGQGLWHNGPFLAPELFGFVGTAHGDVTISFNSTDNFTIHIPIAEMHANGGLFNLGAVDDPNPDGFGANGLGVTLNCTGALSGLISCTGEEVLNPFEDSMGFVHSTFQWRLGGTLDPVHTSEIPVPAAVWLFGSGLLGLTGLSRRKKSG